MYCFYVTNSSCISDYIALIIDFLIVEIVLADSSLGMNGQQSSARRSQCTLETCQYLWRDTHPSGLQTCYSHVGIWIEIWNHNFVFILYISFCHSHIFYSNHFGDISKLRLVQEISGSFSRNWKWLLANSEP